jgi:hypothetical protein
VFLTSLATVLECVFKKQQEGFGKGDIYDLMLHDHELICAGLSS